MISSKECLKLKQCQADTWTTREQLCLSSAVLRSGDQNWVAVSRTLRLLSNEVNRPADWYSTKNCATQYARLLEQVETPKRKREKGEGIINETPGEVVTKMLSKERIEELQGILEEEKASHDRLYKEINILESGQLDHQLNDIWDEIVAEQERDDEEDRNYNLWLEEREQQILALQQALRSPQPKGISSTPKKSSVEPIPVSDALKSTQSSSETSSEVDSLTDAQLANTSQNLVCQSKSGLSIPETGFQPDNDDIKPCQSNMGLQPLPSNCKEGDQSEAVRNLEQQIGGVTTIKIEANDDSTNVDLSKDFSQLKDENTEDAAQKSAHDLPEKNDSSENHSSKINKELENVFEAAQSSTKEGKSVNTEYEEAIRQEAINQLYDNILDDHDSYVKKTATNALTTVGSTSNENFDRCPKDKSTKDKGNKESDPAALNYPLLEDIKNEDGASSDCNQDSNPIPDVHTAFRDRDADVVAVSHKLEDKKRGKKRKKKGHENQGDVKNTAERMKNKARDELATEDNSSLDCFELPKKLTRSEVKKEDIKSEKKDQEGEERKGHRHIVKEEMEDDEVSRDSAEVREILTFPRSERRRVYGLDDAASPVISESTPSSPASIYYGDDYESEKAHKSWKRSITLLWNDIAAHKNASIFLRPITEDKVRGYHSIIYKPMDLQTIKRQIEIGGIRTTVEFHREILLMFLNAKMYNNGDHVFQMAHEMMKDSVATIEEFVNTQSLARTAETPQKSLRRETRESSAKKMEGDNKRKKEGEEKPNKRRK